MTTAYVQLSSTSQIKDFVAHVTRLEGDFDLIAGNYVLDAKSLMGILTIDFSAPVQLKIYNDTKENVEALRPFFVSASQGGAKAE
ncbi:MAG: HPr family phosphocarrier protein [Oscillospiraceae bacterium]